MNNEPVAWTACLNCGKRVTGDSIHTCSPQLKELTDEEIIFVYQNLWQFLPSEEPDLAKDIKKFARAILRKAQDK